MRKSMYHRKGPRQRHTLGTLGAVIQLLCPHLFYDSLTKTKANLKMKWNRRKMGHSERKGEQREYMEYYWSLKRQKSKPGASPRTARADGKMATEVEEQGRSAVSEMLEDVGTGTETVPD